jgi:uncharacterized protein YxjI
MADLFSYSRYLVRKQVLKLFGGAFRVYDAEGKLVLFADQKAFKLREDIRLYTDESKQIEVLTIKARQILDWSAAYDVIDARTGEKVGAYKRKGLKSMVKDEWVIMDAQDQEVGLVREDSVFLALVRRLLTNLVPQTFHAELEGRPVCVYKQRFNPFVLKLSVDFSPDFAKALDRRMGMAGAILLCAIEGRQR